MCLPHWYSFMLTLLLKCLLCLPFQMFPLASKTLRENICTYCYLCCSPHPATDNSKCGWVICSQIALLVPCNTRSWHRREQLRSEVTHWGKDTTVLLILVLCTKARPQWKIFSLIHTNLCTCKDIYRHTFLFFIPSA